MLAQAMARGMAVCTIVFVLCDIGVNIQGE